MAVAFRERVGGTQDPVDDVEVPCLEVSDHLVDETGPVVGEVLTAYDGDGVAQLLLKRFGGLEHETDDVRLYELTVHVGYCTRFIDNSPVPFDEILENDGRCLTGVALYGLIIGYA